MPKRPASTLGEVPSKRQRSYKGRLYKAKTTWLRYKKPLRSRRRKLGRRRAARRAARFVQKPYPRGIKVVTMSRNVSMSTVRILDATSAFHTHFDPLSGVDPSLPTNDDRQIAANWDQYEFHKLHKIEVKILNFVLNILEFGGYSVIIQPPGGEVATVTQNTGYWSGSDVHSDMSGKAFTFSRGVKLDNVAISGAAYNTITTNKLMKNFKM